MKKIVLIGVSIVFLFLTITAIMGLINESLTNEFKNAVPRKFALEKAKGNKELINVIGANIKIADDVKKDKQKGNFTLSLGKSGFKFKKNAIDLKLTITGEKESAFIEIEGYKKDSIWIYEKLDAFIPSKEKRINLLIN